MAKVSIGRSIALCIALTALAARVVSGQTQANLISQEGWSVMYVDSQETIVPGYLGGNAIDGDPSTSWATPWYLVPGLHPPHEILIDMGDSHNVVGFRYLPHQAWQPGRIGEYEFYVSDDGFDWGIPVAVGSFPDRNVTGARDVAFPGKTGRYIRLRALSEQHGRYLTAVAELNVWVAGSGAQAPVTNITSPTPGIVVRAGSAVTLAGTASDPDNQLPLKYRWSAKPGSGLADRQPPQPSSGLLVHFDRAGMFPVTFTTTDSFGVSSPATRIVTVLGGLPVAKTGWALKMASSQETQAGNYAATNAFDNNPNTLWVTQFLSAQPRLPHQIQIDLGTTRDLVGFRYLSRQDEFTSGNVGRYEFYVSADGTNWGAAVATGLFSPDGTEKEVWFPVKSGRFIRFRALSEVNELSTIAVAELSVLERQCGSEISPSVQLVQPRSGYIQSASTLSVVADACLNQAGQGVKFVVDGVTVATDYSAPYSVSATGLSRAEHVVEAYLVDSSGNHVVGPATYDKATPVGIGDTYVAVGDGITYGLGDDFGADDNTADERNMLGGFTSILATALTAARGYPVSVVNEGMVGTSSIDGVKAVKNVLGNYPNANFFLIMYGHNDATLQLPSGRGLVPGNPGYAGSFKENVQKMINKIRGAGKTPLLARHPAAIPLDGPVDSAVQEYNQVIDELAANPNNGVTVVPPDLYTYFRSRTETHFTTQTEPNGLGYQGIAQLWRQRIAP